jgi:hypothetical protein
MLNRSLSSTLDDYIELEVISPIVSLVNGLRRNPQCPALWYQINADPYGMLRRPLFDV